MDTAVAAGVRVVADSARRPSPCKVSPLDSNFSFGSRRELHSPSISMPNVKTGKFDDPIFSWRDAVSAEQSASRSPRTTLMVARALSSSPADPLATATRKPALSWMDVAKLRVQMDLPPAAAPGAALAAALRTDDPAFQTPPRSPGTPFATPALSPQLSTVRRSINDSRPTSARSNSSSSNAEAAVPPQVTLQSQTHEALQKLARCMA